MSNESFMNTLGAMAREDMKSTGVLASLTVAQGILESGWGKSELATCANNLFGIKKGSGWTGDVYTVYTKEFVEELATGNLEEVTVSAEFRVYEDYSGAVADHSALFLASRYAKVLGERDYTQACVAVQEAGYATDPSYSAKLISLIEQYCLYEYDKEDEGMSDSNLVSKVIESPNKSNRTGVISKIAVHCMAGDMTAESCGNYFARIPTQASSHYGIGSDGDICQYVMESERAWCTGGTKTFDGRTGSQTDQIAVTIEVANCGGEPDWAVSDKAYGSLLNLVEDIARRNGLAEVSYQADGSGTLQAHRWYAAKACPGDYLFQRFPDIATKVTERLGGQGQEALETTSSEELPYTVRVTVDELNIRCGAGVTYDKVGCICDRGVYTITEVQGDWGKLKSGVGWICLRYTER